eukprot:5896855-Pleurochrysis_carterae.AAC.1
MRACACTQAYAHVSTQTRARVRQRVRQWNSASGCVSVHAGAHALIPAQAQQTSFALPAGQLRHSLPHTPIANSS